LGRPVLDAKARADTLARKLDQALVLFPPTPLPLPVLVAVLEVAGQVPGVEL
jgi:hypothetical protein